MNTEEQIELLLSKGVADILPNKAFLESLLKKGKKLNIYMGVDPTGPTLHIGHVIQLRKLRQFQDLGHQIIFLIGDFTARIGDPTDKMATRVQLTEKEVKNNFKLYKKQAARFIRFSGKNAAKVKFNNTWLGKLKFADVLNLASHMTVDQMLKRDMFARRIADEKPIYIHEFMYPLMQGYDSVAMNVDGEIGGNDQLFNMLAGRTLLKKMKDKEKFVITVKILADVSGEKMGKTTGNMISLLDTPVDMYGKVMSWTDGMIVPGFELCTDYTMDQIAVVAEEFARGINPRDLKMRLAFEIVKSIAGDIEAKRAEESFVATFQKKEHVDAKEVNGKDRILELVLVEEGIVASKGEVKRLAEAGAISNFDRKEILTLQQIKSVAPAGTYKIGKNRFLKLS